MIIQLRLPATGLSITGLPNQINYRQLEKDFKYRVIKWYCIIFYVLLLYKWMNGMFMYQQQPAFFYLRKDILTWLLMQTGIHQWLLDNKTGWIIADLLFYSMPLLYLLAYRFKKNIAYPVAVFMLVINWSYIQCYTLYPTNSIESYIGWLLFPIVFMPQKQKTFELLFGGLRFFLLFFFVSAAAWKFVQGGIFNISQMSGILLYQHNQLLTGSPHGWQSKSYYFLLQHTLLSYLLYLAATILEISFIAGFFTKRYDRLLVVAFILFIVADYLVMRMLYLEIIPLILPLALKSAENKRVIA